MPQTPASNVVPTSPEGNTPEGNTPDRTPADAFVPLPEDGPLVEIPATRPLTRPATSECWLPAQVARRLINKWGAEHAGGRALVARRRHGVGRPENLIVRDPQRWVYWDVVCIAIERQTGLRFRAASYLRRSA